MFYFIKGIPLFKDFIIMQGSAPVFEFAYYFLYFIFFFLLDTMISDLSQKSQGPGKYNFLIKYLNNFLNCERSKYKKILK